MSDEQGKKPTQITKWDVFALLALTASDFFACLAEMLDVQASFEDDKRSFHEYAARTIEELNEGE